MRLVLSVFKVLVCNLGRPACTGVVDQFLALGRAGHEGGGGRVVEGPGQAVGDAVEPGDGVVGEQRLLAPASAMWWRR